MSRIGKHPVAVPQGVTVTLDGNTLKAKGRLGELSTVLPPEVILHQEDGRVAVQPHDPDDRRRYLLELTDDGLRRLAEAERAASAAERDMLAPLTGEERERLRRYLSKMATHSCAPSDRCSGS